MELKPASKHAIVYGDIKISYPRLRNLISGYAEKFSLIPGDRAVIFAENAPEWIIAMYAIWEHKGILVPVDHLSGLDETAYILSDSRPAVIFTSATRLDLLNQAIDKSGIQTRVVLLESQDYSDHPESTPGQTGHALNFSSYQTDDTAVIIYTSGTTGDPKGVMLSFRNLETNIMAVSRYINIYKPESVVMMLLPVHHIFPLVGTIVIPLYMGATIAMSPSMVSADILKTLQDNRVDIVIGVPRLYAVIIKGIMDKIKASFAARTLYSIARKVKSPAFSKKVFKTVHDKLGGNIHYLVSGGAALDKTVGEQFTTLGFEVLEGYGMTEAAPMITFTQPGRVKIGSPGEVMKQTKVEIRDGEIVASGPNIMKGYYNKPEETAEILHDGWLYTGDLGEFDDEGFLYITGRKKEIIVLSNGKNINPAELEEKIGASPFVKECGVFYHDEQIQAIIQPDMATIAPTGKPASEVIRWEVIEPLNKNISAYKKIMGVHLTEFELPRTRLGKLQRFKLPSMAVLASVGNEHVSDEPKGVEYEIIAEYLAKEKMRLVRPNHHIEMDLGMDSLDKVSFQAWLMQAFGVNMEPLQMTAFNTISELSEYVAEHKTRVEEGKLDWTDIIREKVNLKLPANWFTGRWVVYSSKVFFHLYFRIRGKGTQNIPDAPVIFVPNHQSYLDGLFIASFLRRRQLRKTYFYAKEKHIKQAWMKFLANRNNIIVVDLNKDLKESIQKMAEVLRQKQNMIIFPEGTRTKTGKLGEFKKTFAILARELNVPVVPVRIRGAYEALPSGSKFPRIFAPITIEFLPAVIAEGETYDSLTEKVRQAIDKPV